MIDAVLFDLDGTLISFTRNYADFMQGFARGWGILDSFDPFFKAYSEAILAEGSVTFFSAVQHALTSSGRVKPEDLEQRCSEAVILYAQGTQLLPWAASLIATYAHLPKAIVSNGPHDMQLAAIKNSGLDAEFGHILISGDPDIGIRKPNAEIFWMACHKLGVEPARALMIGDNESADILGAQQAGLQALHISAAIQQIGLHD